jgi:hypothetical protein
VDLLDHLGAALGTASADDDVRPFGSELGRDRAADVAGGSGNERCPAFMPERNSELIGNRGWDVDDAACPEIDELWAPPGWAAETSVVPTRYSTWHPADVFGRR